MIQYSTTTAEIDVKILNVQKKLGVIVKDSDNPAFSKIKPFRYISLDGLRRALHPHFQEQGLMFMFVPSINIDTPSFDWILRDVDSGEFYSGTIAATLKGNTPQDMGSAQTYANRYVLVGLFGIQTDEDDDGNKASGKNLLLVNSTEWKDLKSKFEKDEITESWIRENYLFAPGTDRLFFNK